MAARTRSSAIWSPGHAVDLHSYDSTFLSALKSIVQTRGGSHHGNITLTNQTTCLHWAVGSVRIFGTFNEHIGNFTFIGDSRHTGTGNSKYTVNLTAGGTTDAKTS